MNDLRTRLAAVPEPALERRPEIERAIASPSSTSAPTPRSAASTQDTYWPKWNSPWWHMVLLYELGEERRIPERAVAKMVEGLNALPVKIFPIHQHELPAGADPHRDISCHCAIGSIHQVLSACGVDVDRALPWIAPWFVSYQMADGGLNCDSDAYLRTDECPSSMVGTVPFFEAMLRRRDWTPDERVFAERAAGFLIDRQAHARGRDPRTTPRSATPRSAWLDPCFPRFYFYDVLRGLAALVRFAERGAGTVPLGAIEKVIDHLLATYPDGVVSPRRQAHAGKGTLAPRDGAWVREPASTFPLLEVVSVIGEPNEALTRQWSATRRALIGLIDDGRLAA